MKRLQIHLESFVESKILFKSVHCLSLFLFFLQEVQIFKRLQSGEHVRYEVTGEFTSPIRYSIQAQSFIVTCYLLQVSKSSPVVTVEIAVAFRDLCKMSTPLSSWKNNPRMIFNKRVGHMICGDDRPPNCLITTLYRRSPRVYIRLRIELFKVLPFASVDDQLEIIACFFVCILFLHLIDPTYRPLSRPSSSVSA